MCAIPRKLCTIPVKRIETMGGYDARWKYDSNNRAFPLLRKLFTVLHQGHCAINYDSSTLPRPNKRWMESCKRHNLHQRVLGTIANLGLLAVSGDGSDPAVDAHLDDEHNKAKKLGHLLDGFLSGWGDNMRGRDLKSDFSLAELEKSDNQLLFPAVRFEVARFLWCMIRLGVCHGRSIANLMAYTRALDVLGASAGVEYENVDRPELELYQIDDLLMQICDVESPKPGEREPLRAFAAWTLAHFTETSDVDCRHVANQEGFDLISRVLTDTRLVKRVLSIPVMVMSRGVAGDAFVAEKQPAVESAAVDSYITLKLLAKALANLALNVENAALVERQVDRLRAVAGPTVLSALVALYEFKRQLDMVATPDSARSSPRSSPPTSKLPPASNLLELGIQRDTNERPLYLVASGRVWRPVKSKKIRDQRVRVAGDDSGPIRAADLVGMEVRCFKQEAAHEALHKWTEIGKDGNEARSGELPGQIDELSEVAKGLCALAKHSSVLAAFGSHGVLAPLVELALDPRCTSLPPAVCLQALLQVPPPRQQCPTVAWQSEGTVHVAGPTSRADECGCRASFLESASIETVAHPGTARPI